LKYSLKTIQKSKFITAISGVTAYRFNQHNMKDVRQIKKLKSLLNTMQSDVEVLKIDFTNKQREYGVKVQEINNLKKEIEKLEGLDTLKVSEHAIVRYFERVLGYNIEEIEGIILSDNVVKMIETLGGSGTFPNENFQVVMKNNTVITII